MLRRDVRGDLLDVARLVASGLGSAGRAAGCHAAWHFQLLGELLLFRRLGGNRRGACHGSPAEDQTLPKVAGFPADGPGAGPAGQHPALRESVFQPTGGRGALRLDAGSKGPTPATLAFTNRIADGPSPGGGGRGHGLLFLAHHRQPLRFTLPGLHANISGCTAFSLAASQPHSSL